MAFEPEKILHKHVIRAVKQIEDENIIDIITNNQNTQTLAGNNADVVIPNINTSQPKKKYTKYWIIGLFFINVG